MRRDKAQRAEKRFRKFGKSDPDETGIADPNQSRISDPNGPESVIPLGRNMQVSEALRAHQENGLLSFGKDSEDTKHQLINKWASFRKHNPEKKWMVLAQKWADVSELNQSIRSILQAEGKLQKVEIEVSCTMGERIFTTKFSIGERIRLTKNDYRRGFTNGDLGELIEIIPFENGDRQFRIKLDRGEIISFLASEYSDENNNLFMTQAYASTIYSSQGLTVDGDTFVYHTEGMDRANAYVACSRHKDKCHVFSIKLELTKKKVPDRNLSDDIDNVSQMAKTISCEESKTLATSYQTMGAANLSHKNKKLSNKLQIQL